MKIIAGLGNPGDKYKDTRHNIGFMVTGELAEKYNISGKLEQKFNSMIGKGNILGDDVIIIQPLTFMNLSGEAIIKVINWYKLDYKDLFVVFDDISLDMGVMRFRSNGSDGGHNGIKSIIKQLGGFKDFPRLKVGIGPDPGGAVRQHYVLQKFTSSDREILNKVIPSCIEGIEVYLKDGICEAQNKFNGLNLATPD